VSISQSLMPFPLLSGASGDLSVLW
jgi:hypothetical protein